MSLPELGSNTINKWFKGCPEYLGCYSKNKLPNISKLNGHFVIVNLQDSWAGSGTHWSLLYNVNPDSVDYFDSFGAPPPIEVEERMKESGKKFHWNKMQVQAEKSASCGWWVVRCANALLNHISINKFVNSYSKINQQANEKILYSEFHNS